MIVGQKILSPANLMLVATGVLLGIISLSVLSFSRKWMIISFTGLMLCFIVVLSGRLWERLLMFLTVLFTSFNIKVHFFTINEHIGGANGLRISAVFCILAILYIKLLYDRRGQIRFNWWISAPFMMYLTIATISSLASDNVILGVFQAVQLFQAYLIFLYFSNRLNGEEDFYLVLYAISFAIVLQGVITLAQKYLGLSLDYRVLGGTEETMVETIAGSDVKRFSGLFKHPALLGNFLLMYLPLSLGGILTNRNLWIRLVIAASAGIGFSALIITYSRAAIIGMGIAMTLITLTLFYKRIVKWSTIAWLVMFELLVTVGILIWKGGDIYSRFTQSESPSIIVRFELVDIAIAMIEDHPILGVGLNNFANLVRDYERLTLYVSDFRHPVHNLFLLEVSETGILGGMFFLFFLIGIIITAFKAFNHSSSLRRYMATAVASSFVAFLIVSISDWSYRLPEINTIFFTDLGILGALHFTSEKPRNALASH